MTCFVFSNCLQQVPPCLFQQPYLIAIQEDKRVSFSRAVQKKIFFFVHLDLESTALSIW